MSTPLPDPVVVSAPGKLMVSGEYVVLEGAEAIVAAVSRRVRAWLVAQPPEATGHGPASAPGAHPVPREANAARHAAERRFGEQPGVLAIDVAETRSGDQKLGVGSSAAAAAAAAGLIAVLSGRDLRDPAVRDEVLSAALEGHTAVAPRGSGADVAAATLGGFVRFRRRPKGIECEPVYFPTELEPRVIWTGKQVRTSDMLDRVEGLRRANPNRYVAAMDQLRSAAEAFSAALRKADPARVIAATARYHEAMAALGRAAGVPIVDDTLSHIAALAAEAQGAAKPSGAGGGDVALALFPDRAAAAKFEVLCESNGLRVISMGLGAEGVREEVEVCS